MAACVLRVSVLFEPGEKELQSLRRKDRPDEKTLDGVLATNALPRGAKSEETVTRQQEVSKIKVQKLREAQRSKYSLQTPFWTSQVLCLLASRFNHSCSPNAEYLWVEESQVEEACSLNATLGCESRDRTLLPKSASRCLCSADSRRPGPCRSGRSARRRALCQLLRCPAWPRFGLCLVVVYVVRRLGVGQPNF